MKRNKNTLILGIGNYLMGDEGIGVHVANQLEKELLPVGVDVLDGGTGGFYLLEYFEIYKHVILVDATLDGNPIQQQGIELTPKIANLIPEIINKIRCLIFQNDSLFIEPPFKNLLAAL